MSRWMRSTLWVCLLACRGHAPVAEAPASAAPAAQEAKVSYTQEPEADGLGMRLYDAVPVDGAGEGAPLAAGTELDAAGIDAIFQRVPALEADVADAVPFALRPASSPPPRTGATVQEVFPPEQSGGAAPEVAEGPLTVLRRAPEGEIAMAPHLSVTFSAPMVAVGSVAETGQTVPVKLTPTPPGRWRWLGTRTLMFDPEGRLPMATEFQVEVPTGTTSATGAALAAPVRWTFSTPAPKLEQYWPGEGAMGRTASEPQPLDPVIWLAFDQRVDPAKILASTALTGPSGAVALRLATAEEVAANPRAKGLQAAAVEGRWVALTPAAKLATDSLYTVTVGKGTPSAEGPRVTPADQLFRFRTYAPLRFVSARCWYGSPCPPTSPWSINFSNPLDEAAFDAASVTVTPAVPGLSVTVSGSSLSVGGDFTGRTSYTVRVPASLKDTFGQTLGEPKDVTLAVGPAEKSLQGPPAQMVVVDPSGPPVLSFHTTNHKALRVRVNRVTPADWQKWVDWLARYRYEDAVARPLPGQVLADTTVRIDASADALVETPVDLAPYLKDGAGQLLVYVEPTVQPKERWNRQEWYGWVQVTHIGLTAFADGDDVYGWATDLRDGKPLAGAQIALDRSAPMRTDASGLGRIALPAQGGAQILVATAGNDTAILPQDAYAWGGGGWARSDRSDRMAWYVADDRHLYRPGETVHVKGWMRTIQGKKGGDVAAAPPVEAVRWTLTSAMGNTIASGSAAVGALGGFDLQTTLPRTPDLGGAYFTIVAGGAPIVGNTIAHMIDIQEFRTPEFEVVTSGGDGRYTLGEDATVDVAARYYSGGSLPGAPVIWRVTATPASFVPPGREEWSFGAFRPWWWWGPPEESSGETVQHESVTDGLGEHHLGIHFESLRPARPMSVHAEATVTDVNRQAWTASKDLLVHPAALYVGLKVEKPFLDRGAELPVQALVVDRDGAVAAGVPIELSFARLVWKRTGATWSEVAEAAQPCALTSAAEPGKCRFKPDAGGTWRVLAKVRDAAGRANETEMRVYVSGSDSPPDRSVSAEQVRLIPEGESYEVGQTARIRVLTPFSPADAVLTVQRDGVLRTQSFRVEEGAYTVEVPIEGTDLPEVTIQVDAVGSQVRTDDDGKPRPDLARRMAYATGSVTLKVPPLRRTLAVDVKPAAPQLDPGATSTVAVTVRDADGRPVEGAELVVVAVDEAILALSNYRLPDPIQAFYQARGGGVATTHSRSFAQLAAPKSVGGAPGGGAFGMSGEGVGGGGNQSLGYMADGAVERKSMAPMAEAMPAPAPSAAPAAARSLSAAVMDSAPNEAVPTTPIAVRSNFDPVALWAPAVRTDGLGQATIPLHLPDSLTRYRVMVVAVAGADRFGHGEADVTARLPLMVRPSPPRFLNFGDRFELPIVVQNQTTAPMTVDVAVRATNLALGAGDRAGKRVTVPADGRVEVRFPAAAVDAGTARFQAVAVSGAKADAATRELPVWTPASTEAFATYGTIEAGAVRQPVTAPKDVWPQFGGLEVTTSSTQLAALTDAVVYLVEYPFDCNEQIASRVLAISALRDVLDAFHADGLPPKSAVDASMATDLAHLAARQNYDGGWAFWRKNDPSWPWLSIHVANAVIRAEQKGYAIDPGMKARALNHLRNIESHIPAWYSREAKWSLRAYALAVRDVAGESDPGKAKRLLGEAGVEQLSLEAQGWILPTLVAAKAPEAATIKAWLANHVTETAAGAHFVTSYSDGAQVLLHSDRRADGVLLDALLRTDAKSDLVPKLVEGLLAHRVKGRWGNTGENAFVLLALDRYFHVYEGTTPDFVAKAWLGDGYVGEHPFRGRTTERSRTDVPMAWLADQGKTQDLVLAKEGAGRLYYRIGMSYAPKDLHLPALDQGFTVQRTYEPIDDPADVRRDADGTWRVKAGARVRVRVEMVTPMRRYHVALVDPLPAGLEVVNPDLAVSGALPVDPSASRSPYWWWSRSWYEHEALRDDRVEAFTSLLWDGVHKYTYVARATTPGRFVVPPAHAEEMYTPETFGRSEGDTVVVE